MNENINVHFDELPEGNSPHTSTSGTTEKTQSISNKEHVEKNF